MVGLIGGLARIAMVIVWNELAKGIRICRRVGRSTAFPGIVLFRLCLPFITVTAAVRLHGALSGYPSGRLRKVAIYLGIRSSAA